MAHQNHFQRDFENAKRALLLSLFGPGEQLNPAYIKLAVERLSHVFNKYLLAAMQDNDAIDLSDLPNVPRPQEFLCAHAIDTSPDWENSCWQIVYVNGEMIENLHHAPTVSDFTRDMLADGWKTFTPPGDHAPGTSTTPDGDPVYELYFSRDLPYEWEVPARLVQLPECRVETLRHSAN